MVYNPVLLTRHSHSRNKKVWLPLFNSGHECPGFDRSGDRIEVPMRGFNLKSRITATQGFGSAFRNAWPRAQVEDSPTVVRGHACQRAHPINKCNSMFSPKRYPQ